MDPARKRRIRLVVALTAALLLAGALAYTTFSASNEAITPSKLLAQAQPGQEYRLTGKVVDGSITDIEGGKAFRVRDRTGTASVPVKYVGSIPDPFRDGREVVITVRKSGSGYDGEKDSLVTKCPSKFADKKTA
ncbi:MAG TPA: cytochrome c maturation protein CcmE [Baekduia sp.]|nr:cytochrome c maturation protein CcmE [Baekduia sp.]